MSPTVSILIVTYNSCAVLSECLDSIAAETRLPYEIIIVDNNSQDDTVALVRTYYPQVVLIENKQNVGFATAVNQVSRASVGTYLLLLNPDTRVQMNAIDRLVAFMEQHTKVGIVAPYTVDEQGKPAPNSQAYHTVGSLFWRTQLGGPLKPLAQRILAGKKAEEKSVEAVYGCALLIRSELYHALGGLDERFFLYEEDIDLCHRVLACDLAVVRVANVTIVHYGGQGSTLPDSTPEQKAIADITHRLRSRSLYARKHFSPWEALMLHLGYTFTGVGLLLYSLFASSHPLRNRRRTIGRRYFQTGLGGMR
jgi:GT2 family glycosyltransferase